MRTALLVGRWNQCMIRRRQIVSGTHQCLSPAADATLVLEMKQLTEGPSRKGWPLAPINLSSRVASDIQSVEERQADVESDIVFSDEHWFCCARHGD